MGGEASSFLISKLVDVSPALLMVKINRAIIFFYCRNCLWAVYDNEYRIGRLPCSDVYKRQV